jgi:hypothetical protein
MEKITVEWAKDADFSEIAESSGGSFAAGER